MTLSDRVSTYLPDGAAISSDDVTFIDLRLLAAVFAVPGRAIGRLKNRWTLIGRGIRTRTRRHYLDHWPSAVVVVEMVVQLDRR